MKLKELKGLLLYKTLLLEQGLYWQLTEDLQYLLEKERKWTPTTIRPKSRWSAFVTGVKLGRILGFKLLKITLKNSKEEK